MIERISDTTQTAATAATQKDTTAPATSHTLFGDVLVDELSEPDMAALFSARASTVAASSSVPETATAASAASVTPSADGAVSSQAAANDPNWGPTAESIFGPNVFVKNPSGHGPNGTYWGYNPAYFASQQTADVLAKMLGGTVVERNAICTSGPMVQDQANLMIDLPDGREVNAGLVADIFNHGRCQAVVNQMLKEEVAGAPRVGDAA